MDTYIYKYEYIYIYTQMDILLFPISSLLSSQMIFLFYQSFVGVSPLWCVLRRNVSSRFLGSCVAGLVQLRTCHRRWRKEPVIALVALLKAVKSLEIVGYDEYMSMYMYMYVYMFILIKQYM